MLKRTNARHKDGSAAATGAGRPRVSADTEFEYALPYATYLGRADSASIALRTDSVIAVGENGGEPHLGTDDAQEPADASSASPAQDRETM
jgi:hypothetical protein